MATVKSMLGGRTAPRGDPELEPKGRYELADETGKAALQALQAQLAELSQRCAKTDADLAAARAETTAQRDIATGLRQQLAGESEARGRAEASLASAERALSEARGDLAAERQARSAMQATLDGAIAAAAGKQPINIPAAEPVAYDIVMMDPETGSKKQVTVKPRKG